MKKSLLNFFAAATVAVAMSACDDGSGDKNMSLNTITGELENITYRGGGKYYQVRFIPMLNVRNGPGYNYSVLGSLHDGTKVYVHGFLGDWALISYQENKAYVHKHSLIQYKENKSNKIK